MSKRSPRSSRDYVTNRNFGRGLGRRLVVVPSASSTGTPPRRLSRMSFASQESNSGRSAGRALVQHHDTMRVEDDLPCPVGFVLPHITPHNGGTVIHAIVRVSYDPLSPTHRREHEDVAPVGQMTAELIRCRDRRALRNKAHRMLFC